VHFQLWVINSLLSFSFFSCLLDYAPIVLSFSSYKQKNCRRNSGCTSCTIVCLNFGQIIVYLSMPTIGCWHEILGLLPTVLHISWDWVYMTMQLRQTDIWIWSYKLHPFAERKLCNPCTLQT
jgi:hypothetical protein